MKIGKEVGYFFVDLYNAIYLLGYDDINKKISLELIEYTNIGLWDKLNQEIGSISNIEKL